jgi:hypothetical protein
MTISDDIETALRAALPADLHVSILDLARLLANAAGGAITYAEVQQRIAADPGLASLMQALAGQTLTTGTVTVSFAGGDQQDANIPIGNFVGRDLITISTSGGDYAGRDIDKRIGEVFVEGNVVNQPGWNVTGDVYNIAGDLRIDGKLAPALHQLRAPVSDFVGREREIDQLVHALTSGTAATISGVRGMGGIGKSQLAYIVADRVKDTFADAQIVVELRSASRNPLTLEQVLGTVIHAFEPGRKLPEDLGQLTGIYNSMLDGKRVLVLADDAKDAAQVRPLLPPSGCALLLTSRNRFSLPGMVALDLGTLSPEEAERLLLEICPRIGDQVSELAKLCGYLPLALRISASLLREHESRDVARYLEQLRMGRLQHLSDPDNPNDPQASVEASLRLSYEALEPVAQSALCQLSVFPNRFDIEAAQSVLDPEYSSEEVMAVLRKRSLLLTELPSEVKVPRKTKKIEWYSLHDLVRDFAAHRLRNRNSIEMRRARYYSEACWRWYQNWKSPHKPLTIGISSTENRQLLLSN